MLANPAYAVASALPPSPPSAVSPPAARPVAGPGPAPAPGGRSPSTDNAEEEEVEGATPPSPPTADDPGARLQGRSPVAMASCFSSSGWRDAAATSWAHSSSRAAASPAPLPPRRQAKQPAGERRGTARLLAALGATQPAAAAPSSPCRLRLLRLKGSELEHLTQLEEGQRQGQAAILSLARRWQTDARDAPSSSSSSASELPPARVPVVVAVAVAVAVAAPGLLAVLLVQHRLERLPELHGPQHRAHRHRERRRGPRDAGAAAFGRFLRAARSSSGKVELRAAANTEGGRGEEGTVMDAAAQVRNERARRRGRPRRGGRARRAPRLRLRAARRATSRRPQQLRGSPPTLRTRSPPR